MTWHETIEYIRTQPFFNDLVRLAYFDADLQKNVTLFGESEEFKATLHWIKLLAPHAKTIVDVGAGNGIAAVNFALLGYQVTAIEPDPSNTVGKGAIDWLKKTYQLDNLNVLQITAEDLSISTGSVDVVYVRQAMHHAHNLHDFIANCSRILKKGGLLITVRDHVVWNEKDKNWFLESHPLHRFYGGENAYHPNEYRHAMELAGLNILNEIKYFDSVINYFPTSVHDIEHHQENTTMHLKKTLYNKLGFFAKIPLVFSLYQYKNRRNYILNEEKIPGRMYSYICQKK